MQRVYEYLPQVNGIDRGERSIAKHKTYQRIMLVHIIMAVKWGGLIPGMLINHWP